MGDFNEILTAKTRNQVAVVLDSYGTDKRVKGIVVECLKMGFGKTAMRIKFPDLCVK
ncbi:hypothetical protein OIU74_025270, partial [Salix koriyanagi]